MAKRKNQLILVKQYLKSESCETKKHTEFVVSTNYAPFGLHGTYFCSSPLLAFGHFFAIQERVGNFHIHGEHFRLRVY